MKTSLIMPLQRTLNAVYAFMIIAGALSFSRCSDPEVEPLTVVAGLSEPIPWEAMGTGKLGFTRYFNESTFSTLIEYTDFYVIDIDSKTSFAITKMRRPAISPDGRNVAFDYVLETKSNVGIYNFETGSLTTISDPTLPCFAATWIADSETIIFQKADFSVFPKYQALFRQSITGNNLTIVRTLEDAETIGSSISASADDRLVLVLWGDANSSTPGPTGIFTLNLDGSGLTQLTQDSIGFGTTSPVWSPDGGRIAYLKRTNNISTGFQEVEVMVMDHDGGNASRVTAFRVPFFSGEASLCIAWSPDGDKLAFNRLEATGMHIYVINVDGTQLTQVTSLPDMLESDLSWSR